MEEKKEAGRKPGHKKTGGRKKGTPNKITADVRILFSDFAQENFSEFAESFNEIDDPEKKCKVYIDLCRYVVPALQSVNVNDVTEKKKTIEAALEKLSEEAK
jgi:hypothetical protein